MNPSVDNLSEANNTLKFTLSGVNVSMANALRRIMLSDIPCVVLDTSIDDENDPSCVITSNNSRFTNEIIKQRLGCIPVHINDLSTPIDQYVAELNVKNNTMQVMTVTSKDFKIKNTTNGKYLSDADTNRIFPSNKQTGYHIDIMRLRPKISEEIPGEEINLTCKFKISDASEDASYTVVSTCAYGNTPDEAKQSQAWKDYEIELKSKDMTKEDLDQELKNWNMLSAQRHYKSDSFDFTVETVGVYKNMELVNMACDAMNKKIEEQLLDKISNGTLIVNETDSSMPFTYDITIENEDYTVGKVIEYMLYALYFKGDKTLKYCGFEKKHPHDLNSTIRISFNVDKGAIGIDKLTVNGYLKNVSQLSIELFNEIKSNFNF